MSSYGPTTVLHQVKWEISVDGASMVPHRLGVTLISLILGLGASGSLLGCYSSRVAELQKSAVRINALAAQANELAEEGPDQRRARGERFLVAVVSALRESGSETEPARGRLDPSVAGVSADGWRALRSAFAVAPDVWERMPALCAASESDRVDAARWFNVQGARGLPALGLLPEIAGGPERREVPLGQNWVRVEYRPRAFDDAFETILRSALQAEDIDLVPLCQAASVVRFHASGQNAEFDIMRRIDTELRGLAEAPELRGLLPEPSSRAHDQNAMVNAIAPTLELHMYDWIYKERPRLAPLFREGGQVRPPGDAGGGAEPTE